MQPKNIKFILIGVGCLVLTVVVCSVMPVAHAQTPTFTSDLYYGLQNNAGVTQLQQFLTAQGLYSGPITGNFYSLTLAAVKVFQTKQGITPVSGYFGPLTRAAANGLAGTGTGAGSGVDALQSEIQTLLSQVATLQAQLAEFSQSSTTPVASSSSPTIASFFAPLQSITVGQSTSLTWTSVNATGCAITGPGAPSGEQAANGTVTVVPTVTGSATYTMTCSGPGGTSAPATTAIAATNPYPTTIAVAANFNTPATTQYAMPSSQVPLAIFDFSEPADLAPAKLSALTITDTVASPSVRAAFSNLQLYSGATAVAMAQSANQSSPVACSGGYCYTYTFTSFSASLVIPRGGTASLTLKGDLAPWATGSATDDTTHTFSIATSSDVVESGASGNVQLITLTNATGNPMTVLRSTLTPAVAAVGGTRAARNTHDEVATVTMTANSAGPATLQALTLTFSGSLVSSTAIANFLQGVQLAINGTALTPSQASSSINTSNGTVTWTFNPGTSPAGTQITAGASVVFQVYMNDSAGTNAGSSGVSLGLNIGIQNANDVSYKDSSVTDTTGTTVSLPANIVPLTAQISFAQGA